MDIVLIHLGDGVPPYFFDCVNQIRQFTDCRVVCAFSYKPEFHFDIGADIMLMDLSSLPTTQKQKDFIEMGFFNKWDENPLWRYSCERFYALETVMDTLGIEECIHLESDNLIYGPPDEEFLRETCEKGIGITAITRTLYSAGIMYVGSKRAISDLTSNLNILMAKGDVKLAEQYGNEMMNEMRMLNILYCSEPFMFLLPTTPAPNSKYVYDCASWGQFVGGTHVAPDVPYKTDAHNVGYLLNQHIHGVEWVEGKPYVTTQRRKSVPLFNLHIHSKNLAKWRSYGDQ